MFCFADQQVGLVFLVLVVFDKNEQGLLKIASMVYIDLVNRYTAGFVRYDLAWLAKPINNR